MNTLICPLPTFQRLLRALAENRRGVAFARVGRHETRAGAEWFVRDFVLSPAEVGPTEEAVFRISLTSDPQPMLAEALQSLSSFPVVAGHLYIGDGPKRSQLAGVVRMQDIFEPLHRIMLTGAGMHTISIHHDEPLPTPSSPTAASLARWSRTIGALGGEDIWRRLIGLRIALIGCGRTGSLVASSLIRLGVQELTLIDPDLVEEHNLGEMDLVTQADLGQPKAKVLAAHLRESTHADGYAPSIQHISAAVTAVSSLAACKDAQVLFCCVDNDAARLCVALIATLYHKVLLDIGTGIDFPQLSDQPHPQDASPRPRTMGADVRMILPGNGCLLCVGNLVRYSQAIEELCQGRALPAQPEEWWQQRAGSLRTLNQLAAASAVQMLQDLVAERIHDSQWARVEFDAGGRMAVTYPPIPPPDNARPCLLCAKAGLGDAGLGWTQ